MSVVTMNDISCTCDVVYYGVLKYLIRRIRPRLVYYCRQVFLFHDRKFCSNAGLIRDATSVVRRKLTQYLRMTSRLRAVPLSFWTL